MELRDYLYVLNRRWPLFMSILILVLVLFAFYALTRPISFDGTATLTFIKQADEPAATSLVLGSDNLNALQASGAIADMVTGWFLDPTVIVQTYEASGLAVPPVSVLELDKSIKTKRLTGTSVQVITSARSAEEAEKLADTATDIAVSRLTDLETKNIIDTVEVIESDPISSANVSSTTLTMLIGAVFGTFLALILVFLVEYLKPSRKS